MKFLYVLFLREILILSTITKTRKKVELSIYIYIYIYRLTCVYMFSSDLNLSYLVEQMSF